MPKDPVMPLHKDYKYKEKDPKLQKIYEKVSKNERDRLQSGKTVLAKGQVGTKKIANFKRDSKTSADPKVMKKEKLRKQRTKNNPSVLMRFIDEIIGGKKK